MIILKNCGEHSKNFAQNHTAKVKIIWINEKITPIHNLFSFQLQIVQTLQIVLKVTVLGTITVVKETKYVTLYLRRWVLRHGT